MSIGKEHLDLSVKLATRIMSLPAVPTCTWCDIAAEALTAAFDRCVVLVRFRSPTTLAWSPIGVAYKPENDTIVESLRQAFHSRTQLQSDAADRDRTAQHNAVRRLSAVGEKNPDQLDALLINLGGRAVFRDVVRLDEEQSIDLVVECVNLSNDAQWLDEGFQEAMRAGIRLIAQRARLATEPTEGHMLDPLNLREVKVLDALTHGKTIAEIAGEMNRSTHTVRDYLKSMHKKIGASNRAELIARATGRR